MKAFHGYLFLTVLFSTWSTANSLSSIVVVPNCTKQYKLQKPDRNDLIIDLLENEKYICTEKDKDLTSCEDCKSIVRLRNKIQDKMGTRQTSLVMPRMKPIAHDGKYLANIELELKPNKEGKYPARMFLEASMYLRTKQNGSVVDQYVDKKCFLMKLSKRKTKVQGVVKFSFACIELVNEAHRFYLLATQLWSLPDQRYSDRCLHKRAIAGPSTCGIQCSEELLYPLSLQGENEYELCTCADKMEFSVTPVIKGREVRINLTGLPPLIGHLTAKLYNISGKIVHREILNTTGVTDGRLQMYFPKLHPGNYTIYVDADCQFTRDTGYNIIQQKKQNVNLKCSQDDIHVQSTFDILEPSTTRIPFKEIFIVIGAVLVVGIGTCIVFVKIKCQTSKPRQRQNESDQIRTGEELSNRGVCIEMTPLEYDGGDPDSALLSPIPVDIANPSQASTYDIRTNDKLFNDTEDDLRKEKSINNYSDKNDNFIHLKTETAIKSVITTFHPDNKTETGKKSAITTFHPENITETGKKLVITTIHPDNKTETGKKSVITTFHPDNEAHINKVKTLVKYSRDQDIHMICSCEKNWRDFAENVIDVYHHIVIILSEGLIQLCKCYKDGGMENEDFQRMVSKRHQEYIPCIVMDKVRVKIHENPRRSDFTLHLVTICDCEVESKTLLDGFYEAHDFLHRFNKVEEYLICIANISQSRAMDTLITNITS